MRQKIDALIQEIHDHKGELTVRRLIELLDTMLVDYRNRLETTNPENFILLQGHARAVRKLRDGIVDGNKKGKSDGSRQEPPYR